MGVGLGQPQSEHRPNTMGNEMLGREISGRSWREGWDYGNRYFNLLVPGKVMF